METNLYDDLFNAGCVLDHHESDLYVKADANALAILQRHGKGGYKRARKGDTFQLAGCSMFRSQVDGEMWIDVPFAYQPFWKRVSERVAKAVSP